MGPRAPPQLRRAKSAKNRHFSYCLVEVQRPVQPSDRTNEPEPLWAVMRPELVQLRPPADPCPLEEPLGLT